VAAALEALELVCDTYLSVSTPVQIAAPALIASGAALREQVLARVRRNDTALRRGASLYPAVDVLQADAGWSAVVRVPATRSEEALVLGLLEDRGVLVHPGYFFDMPHEAFVIVSLLPRPAVFDEGVSRLLEYCGG
jgi:alanine-synthesizing transaminase